MRQIIFLLLFAAPACATKAPEVTVTAQDYFLRSGGVVHTMTPHLIFYPSAHPQVGRVELHTPDQPVRSWETQQSFIKWVAKKAAEDEQQLQNQPASP